MKRTILILVLLATTMATWASKAMPGFVTVQQKDGTTLSIQLIGNAEYSYSVTTDGVILYQEDTDYFVASIDDNGDITSTGILAHNAGQRSSQETAAISKQDRSRFESTMTQKIGRKRVNTMQNATPPYFPHSGSPKVLVILAEYQDVKFRDGNCKEVFEQYLNQEGAFTVEGDSTKKTLHKNMMSVGKYFNYCSYGQFTPEFEVYGPVTLSHEMAYYGANYNNSDAYVKSRFIPEVCSLAKDLGVDFSQYDSQNDGYVDLVYVIYAGYGENYGGNSTDCIWPHVGSLGNTNTKYDGKIIYRYGVSNELNGNNTDPPTPYINGIGLFCHEFSHGMGLPDLYPSNALNQATLTCNQNMDNYDLMDGGEYLANGWAPKTYLAWERERCGWMEIEELKEPANISTKPINYDGGKAYKIVNEENSNEYIVLENIQQRGMDVMVPGHGMLAYRIQENKLGPGYINATALNPAVAIVAADSLFMPDWFYLKGTTVTDTEYSVSGYTGTLNIDPIFVSKYKNMTIKKDEAGKAIYNKEAAGDPWPGTSNVTEMTENSYFAFSSLKTLMKDKPVTDIQETDGVITFKFMGGIADGIAHIGSNANAEDKNVYTIDGRLTGTSLEGLKPGIYIQNHRKVVVR